MKDTMTLNVHPIVGKALKTYCAERGTTMAVAITEAVMDYLEAKAAESEAYNGDYDDTYKDAEQDFLDKVGKLQKLKTLDKADREVLAQLEHVDGNLLYPHIRTVIMLRAKYFGNR